MTEFDFYKMHGAGNDFILIDDRTEKFPQQQAELIRRLCAAHTGVGADGLMLLRCGQRAPTSLPGQADFCLLYFNSDGRPAEMCGNGARCAVFLAHQLGLAPQRCRFEILGVIYHAEVQQGKQVRLRMQPPRILAQDEDLHELHTAEFEHMMLLDTGVPHLVVALRGALEELDVVNQGRRLRCHQRFQPQGVNVNFVSRQPQNRVNVRVYERGVENETLACGTGAVACGIFASRVFRYESPVTVHSPGGDLNIEFGPAADEVYLRGPVTTVFTGRLNLADFGDLQSGGND